VKDLRFERPPLCPRFCTGGADSLLLSPGGILVLLASATLIALASLGTALICGLGLSSAKTILALPLDFLASVALGAMAGRWLGCRIATLAGLAYLVLNGMISWGHVNLAASTSALTITIAISFFARANVLGRLPIDEHRWLRTAFFAALGIGFLLTGPVVLLVVFVACSLYLVSNQDHAGLPFLTAPAGLAGLVILAAARLALVGPEWIWLPGNHLHWPAAIIEWMRTPHLWKVLLAATVASSALAWSLNRGLRHAYLAIPIWRLTACWLAASLLSGMVRHAVVLAPLSLVAAAGLDQLISAMRRAARRFWLARPMAAPARTANRIPAASEVRVPSSMPDPRRKTPAPHRHQRSSAAGLDGRRS
jgi:hypothetical protein